MTLVWYIYRGADLESVTGWAANLTIRNFSRMFMVGGEDMRKVRESSVENHLVEVCRRAGLPCLKFDPSRCIGMPDRLVLLPGGKVMWVELKTDGGRLSEMQKYRHAELKKLGHEVRVIWTADQADQLINNILI